MRKIILISGLLISTLVFSQAGKKLPQNIIQITYVQVEHEDFAEFESRELNHWSKVSDKAIKSGNQVGWAFFRLANAAFIEDQASPTHAFVNIYKDFKQLADAPEAVWGNAQAVLGIDPNLISTNDLSKTMMIQTYKVVDNIPTEEFKYAVWNYAKPKNMSGFLEENSNLWKPYFEKKINKDGFAGWGVAARVHPQGMEESSILSWDHYTSLEAAMHALSPTDYDSSILSKSKMSEYDPDGFRYRVLVELLKFNM
ncbi:MAG: hypothetical protein P8H38_06510 [Flavobacteriaceae bacterium]|jgi:hypothetical protein|nr:hypothetical protein [Flavobacteriaceae bacterium]